MTMIDSDFIFKNEICLQTIIDQWLHNVCRFLTVVRFHKLFFVDIVMASNYG